ncbi:MAG TPA: hypothetical protein VHW90_02005 [Stellaceae bacterium]|nr:hypothetical protein [Stellaceae bacterium]
MAAEAVRALMFSWFLAHNYSPVQAEAMVRQANIESGLQPCVRSRTGSWLYGWVGVRRHALAAYAGTASCPSVNAQLAFADRELRSDYASFWEASPRNAFTVLRQCFGRGRC